MFINFRFTELGKQDKQSFISAYILIIYFSMHTSQIQQFNSLKRRTYTSETQQAMHLAVFPKQLIFRKGTEDWSALYFQKKYQILGKISSEIPPQDKGNTIKLQDIDNLIYFRLFSEDNDTYQWSLYRVYGQNHEQYVETCNVTFKELINKFFYAQKTQSSGPSQSFIRKIFEISETNLLFNKSGVQLNLELLVADQTEKIREYVQRRFCTKINPNIKISEQEKPKAVRRVEMPNLIQSAIVENKESQELSSHLKSDMKETGESYGNKLNLNLTNPVSARQSENIYSDQEEKELQYLEGGMPLRQQGSIDERTPIEEILQNQKTKLTPIDENVKEQTVEITSTRLKMKDSLRLDSKENEIEKQVKFFPLKKTLFLILLGLLLIIFGAAAMQGKKKKKNRSKLKNK